MSEQVLFPWKTTWRPGSGRPRIVVENSNGGSGLAQAEALHDAGFDVAICGGPASLPDHSCPLIDDASCPLVDSADVVLFDLDLEDDRDRNVLETLRARYPALPVVLELPDQDIRDHHDLLAGCHVVRPFDPHKLAMAANAAYESAKTAGA